MAAWYRRDCTCASAAPAQLDVLSDAVDERLERGLARVRRAYPQTDIRLVRSMGLRRPGSCLVRLRMVAAFPYAGSARALPDGSAEVIIRSADFDDFRGHVCSSKWLYLFVELWPMDAHLFFIGVL